MIYLIRHGEAAASWGAHPDPGLSENGQAQARSVAETLSSFGIERIFSSPMARCQETAAAFGSVSGLNVTIEPNVTEIPTPAGIEDRVTWLRQLMSGEWSAAPDVVATWHKNLIATVESLPPQTAVFTHFVAINALVGHLEQNNAVTVFRPNYCSLTKLERTDESIRLITRGDELETRVL